MKQIFPKEIIENTVEVHRFKHKVTSKIIYGILLLGILSISVAMPFVFMDIYSSAQGILKAEKERNQISSLYSGKIKAVFIKENQSVKLGDTLLIIDNTVGKEKLNLISSQLDQTNMFVDDLEFLSNTKKLSQDSLQSFLYQKQYIQYAQKLRELQTRYSKTRRDFARQKKLFNKAVIAKVNMKTVNTV